MTLFQKLMKKFFKKEKNIETNINYEGWNCITKSFEKVYPNQNNPLHFAPIVSWKFGGPDPLDGISIYDGGDYYHFVTYGFSELYEKELENKEYSGYGFELTIKLKKAGNVKDEDLHSMCKILQQLGNMSYTQGSIFSPYEYIYTGQETGIDSNGVSKLTGFVTIVDELVKDIQTPNGKVTFIQLVGMTNSEILQIINKEKTAKELIEHLGHSFTDFNRDSLIKK